MIHDSQGRPFEIVGSWADISARKKAETGARRAHGADERPRDPGRRQPRHHLHHPSLGRLCLHLRQRESECDHGLCAVGDARRQEVLGQASASGGRRPRVRGIGAADRPGRRQPRIPFPASRRPPHLDPGHVHRHQRRRGQAEGDRGLVGGRVGPQAGRGRAQAPRRAGRAAQPLHPRDVRPLSDRRGGVDRARIAYRTADRRGKAQDHHDHDRPQGLYLAVGAAAAATGGGAAQPLPHHHGVGDQAVSGHHRRVHRRCDLRAVRGPGVAGGRRPTGGRLRRGDAIGDGRDQRAESRGRPARDRNGHRHSHRPGGGGQYRIARADEIRRGRQPRQSHLPHPVLHHRRPDPDLGGDPPGRGTNPQARQADRGARPRASSIRSRSTRCWGSAAATSFR